LDVVHVALQQVKLRVEAAVLHGVVVEEMTGQEDPLVAEVPRESLEKTAV
jgi:hypothetical protein